MQKDSYLLGVILGFLVPLLGVLFFYVVLYIPDNVSFSSFLFLLRANHSVVPKMLSLGMIACIPLFTYYRNRKLFKTLYGIFIPVILYALLVVGYKLEIF